MNLLFDIGNVLLRVDFGNMVERLAPPPGERRDRVLRRILASKDDYETGRIGTGEFVATTIERLGGGITRAEFEHAWCDVFEPIEAMWRCVKALKAAGHRLILLSNTNALHADNAFRRFPGFGLFEGAVFSHEVGCMKPHDGIYRHAFERFRLDPRSTLYIDDLQENIDAGRRLGLLCWRYHEPEHPAFVDWLEHRLGGPLPG